MTTRTFAISLLAGLMGGSLALAVAETKPLGEPQLERPTLRSLGVYWIIQGDDQKKAAIQMEYRKVDTSNWRRVAPLFRVERKAHRMERYDTQLQVPDDGWLFAGSAVLLEPDTAYELKLTLDAGNGQAVTRLLKARTRAEPRLGQGSRERHVVSGSGGGTGTAADPFKGLAAAHDAAQPGDLFLVHAGMYQGSWTVTRSGEETRPIVWRGSGDGEAIIDGQGSASEQPAFAVAASGTHDVWFENLTIRNGKSGVVFHDAARLVFRRCHIHGVEYGLNATRDRAGIVNDHFISDNVIEGPSTWPRTKGIENARGIQVTGQGHVVCYNLIRGFADAIDTFPSIRCAAIDFHNNDIREMTDDGIEMDYSERNTRCFHNRLTNIFQGISLQPVYGGPVYVFRNVMYNVGLEPFKLHNSPSGGLLLHNTIVKNGIPSLVYTPRERVRNCLTRNNLFIGTAAAYAMEFSSPMVDCDFDYDGFGGGPFKTFLRWNNVRYATFDEVQRKAPVEKHAVLVEAATAFASGVVPPENIKVKVMTPPDLRLSPKSSAVDAGQVLPGFNDDFRGRLPDLGAYELGDSLPHFGPRSPIVR